MDRESELLAFLDEVLEMRILNRSDASRYLPEVIEISKEITTLFESVTNEETNAKLRTLEELKNAYAGTIFTFIYKEAVRDMANLLQLIFKAFFKSQ